MDDSNSKASPPDQVQQNVFLIPEEFTVLSCSVDRIKYSIGSLVSKIDTVFLKLEATENEEKQWEKY